MQNVLREVLSAPDASLTQLADAFELLLQSCASENFSAAYITQLRAHLWPTFELPAVPERLQQAACRRPAPRPDLEQLPCDLASSAARAALLDRLIPEPATVTLLGDDDLVSFALPARFRTTIVELDERLIPLLQSSGARVIHADLKDGAPPAQAICADPPYAALGMRVFLQAAREALLPGGVFLLSTAPTLLEEPLRHDFDVEAHLPGFNRYPFPAELRAEFEEELLRLHLPESAARQLSDFPWLSADLFVLRHNEDSSSPRTRPG